MPPIEGGRTWAFLEQNGGPGTFQVSPDLPMWPSEMSRLVVLGVFQTLGLRYWALGFPMYLSLF